MVSYKLWQLISSILNLSGKRGSGDSSTSRLHLHGLKSKMDEEQIDISTLNYSLGDKHICYNLLICRMN